MMLGTTNIKSKTCLRARCLPLERLPLHKCGVVFYHRVPKQRLMPWRAELVYMWPLDRFTSNRKIFLME